jgi:hypothetical protein
MKKPAGGALSTPGPGPLCLRPGRLALLAVLSLSVAMHASAAELDTFGGELISDRSGATTYTWGIEYREPLSEHWSGSFIWLNEGHLPHNHRDGQAVQAWWHTLPGPMGLSFEVGLGPYVDYDTHVNPDDADSEDRHGWGGLASADLRWDFALNWSTYLRLNEVDTTAKHVSTGMAAGISYVFATNFATRAAAHATADPTQQWEVDTLLGARIVNSFQSESGGAEAIDARLRLSRHIDLSATLVTGQDTTLGWKDGLALQVWLEQALNAKLRAGIGAGTFLVTGDSSLRGPDSPENVAAAFSVTLAYLFTPRWLGRITWTRLGTGNDHDCDLLLAGAGYQL